MSECIPTGSSVLPCRKRLKYSGRVSVETSEFHAENNSSSEDAEQMSTVNDNITGFKNDSSSGLNEREISETLRNIKSENDNSDFMVMNSMNESSESEMIKILREMKEEQCSFQKEVLTRLQSIETEVNKLKNVLCMSQLPKTHIRLKRSGGSQSFVVGEENNFKRSTCPCKHPETHTADGKTSPSIVHIEPLCETEIGKGNTDSSVTDHLSKTEINNMDKAICIWKHHKTQAVRDCTDSSIIESSCETSLNQSDSSLCINGYFETSVTNNIVKSHAETDALSGHSKEPIAIIVRESGLPKLPVDSIDALENIEQWLDAKDNVQNLIQHFYSIGGDNVRDTIKRILTRTFTPNIAMCINWTGKNNKYPLGKGCLVKVIIAAVKLTHRHEEVMEKTIEEFIKVWFRFAKDRNGGRERRRYANYFMREEEMLIIP